MLNLISRELYLGDSIVKDNYMQVYGITGIRMKTVVSQWLIQGLA